MPGIPLYTEINDLHHLTGSAIRARHPLFHCFRMEDANDVQVEVVPPHRVSFYTLALSQGTRDLNFQINADTFEKPSDFLLCVAPGQVARWEKRGDWQGYCLFFKPELLDVREHRHFLERYPFFNIQESNLLPITQEQFDPLTAQFEDLIREQEQLTQYSLEIISTLIQGLLWKARRIYESSFREDPATKAYHQIAAQFQYLINQHFLTDYTVAAYAKKLNITPNHLSQTIKEVTGKTASSLIQDRRLTEAKYLLKHTDETVHSIALTLGYSEGSHFAKFFRKQLGVSPAEYRISESEGMRRT